MVQPLLQKIHHSSDGLPNDPGFSAMFTIGQTIVLGLAGSVYVVGAALLLGGRSLLRGGRPASSDGEGGWVVRVGTAERPPAYFLPDFEGCVAGPRSSARTLGRKGERAPTGGTRKFSPAAAGHQGTDRKRGGGRLAQIGSPLAAPICLN